MEWIEYAAPAITGIAVTLVMAYANAKATKAVDRNSDGKYELKANGIHFWLGLPFILFALAALASLVIFYEEGTLLLISIVIILSGGLGSLLLMHYYNHRLIFNEHIISVINWKGETTTITWEDIEDIKFSRNSGYLKLQTESGKLKISQQMNGLIVFIKMMESRTRFKAKDLKLPFSVD